MATSVRALAATLLLLPGLAAAQPDFTALVRDASPAVVSIRAAYSIAPVVPDVPHDEGLEAFLERLALLRGPDFEPPALGTGFLVSREGHVLTNFHVVEEATDDEVVVRFADGRETLGRVDGVDPDTDLALVRIDAPGVAPVRIGDPRRLQPGEWVATIGTPFGFEQSVAAGIVSATRRGVPVAPHIPFIQTDLAMNPGHSGAPLFNARGEVVGVNSLIFSNTGASIGVSFAIPIDLAMQVVGTLRRHGRVARGHIGVRLQAIGPELARGLRLASTDGALVTEVDKGGPAERAGIRAGDVLLELAGRRVATPAELMALVAAEAAGTPLRVRLVRRGKPLEATVRVAASVAEAPRPRDAGGTDRFGLLVAPLAQAQRRRLKLEAGVVVHRAEGAARRAGLIPGDVIVSVGATPASSVEAFRAAVERALPGDSVVLLVARAGARAFVALRVP